MLAALLLYPLTANLLLNSDWGRSLLLDSLGRTKVSWESAWTVVPGLFHVRQLQIDAWNRDLPWRLETEKSHLWVNLLALPARRFSVVRARGEGFACGFEAPPEGDLGPRPPVPKRQWRISLSGIRLEGLRSVELGVYRLFAPEGTGIGRLAGEVDVVVRGELEVRNLLLDLEELLVQRAGETVAELSFLQARLASEPFLPAESRGRMLFRPLSGTLDIQGESRSLDFLNGLFAKAPWLEVGTQSGALEARVELEKGVLGPGSRVHLESPDLTVRYLDYTAAGSARLKGSVEDAKPLVVAAFGDFSLRKEPLEQPYVRGRQLTVRIQASSGDLAETADVEAEIDLPSSQVPDLTVYNLYLPARSGLEIIGGSGTLEAHLSLSTAARSRVAPLNARVNQGTIRLASPRITVETADLEMAGSFEMTSNIDDVDAQKRTLRLAAARIDLADATLKREGKVVREEWAGRVELRNAAVALDRPIRGSAHLELALTDSRPVLAFFAEHRPKLDRVAKLVNVRDIVGSARLHLGSEALILDELRLEGKRLAVEGRLCLGSTLRTGALHVKAFGIGLGSWFEADRRRWTLVRPRRWYEERLAGLACRPGAVGSPGGGGAE